MVIDSIALFNRIAPTAEIEHNSANEFDSNSAINQQYFSVSRFTHSVLPQSEQYLLNTVAAGSRNGVEIKIF